VDKLRVRDRLVSRSVCKDWNSFLITTALLDEVKVKVQDTESVLSSMVNFPLSGCWGSYEFHSLDLTRSSTSFWNLFGEHITSIDFYDCFITPQLRGPSSTVDYVTILHYQNYTILEFQTIFWLIIGNYRNFGWDALISSTLASFTVRSTL